MKTELQIIDLLARNPEKSFTINEIARELNRYYSFVNKVIKRLIKEKIVIGKKVGKAYLCSLNFENEKTLTLLSIAEIEKKERFYRKNRELKLVLEDFVKAVKEKFRNCIITIVLFGSWVKGTATEESDIDILIITKRKFEIEKILKEIYAKYGREISVAILTPTELKKQKEKEIIKEIIKNHCVLYGAENFVNLVLK
ncbi:MAG: nucleotidyltransferase domain-containing protein [Nanoarchaeota archaeon]|nr:nucleotidyltransferase domain-containing protein [Nanoarchaeota archaeon]